MNLPSESVWFGIALILLGLERLITSPIPPWVAGVILFVLGVLILL